MNTPSVRGFTLIEVLVAVIIFITLAAIVLVSLNDARLKSMDTQRKQDMETIALALRLYRADYGHALDTGSGCGGNGNGRGWFNHNNGGSYPKSMAECLVEAGYLPQDIADPTGATSASASNKKHAYMKYGCVKDGRYVTYVFASLFSEPRFIDGPTNNLCDDGGLDTLDTSYGMNYWVKI